MTPNHRIGCRSFCRQTRISAIVLLCFLVIGAQHHGSFSVQAQEAPAEPEADAETDSAAGPFNRPPPQAGFSGGAQSPADPDQAMNPDGELADFEGDFADNVDPDQVTEYPSEPGTDDKSSNKTGSIPPTPPENNQVGILGNIASTQYGIGHQDCVQSMESFGDMTPRVSDYMCYLCTYSGISWRLTCPSTLPIWPTALGLAIVSVAVAAAAVLAGRHRPWRHQLNSLIRGPASNRGLIVVVLLIGCWAVVLQSRAATLVILDWGISLGGNFVGNQSADIVFVNVFAFSPTIAAGAFVSLWWLRKAAQALFLGTASGRRWAQHSRGGGYITRDWSMAASEDVFRESTALIGKEQSHLFILAGLLGVPYFTLACTAAMPHLFAIEDADYSGTFRVLEQPTLGQVMTMPWSSFPKTYEMTGEELEAAQDAVIGSTPWIAACAAMLGYMMLAAILVPTQLFTNTAANAAVWVAGTPRLKRMMAMHGVVLSMVVFAAVAYLTHTSEPLGPVLGFVYLLIVVIASCYAWIDGAVQLRGSGLRPLRRDSPRRMVMSVQWMVFLPLLLAAGYTALNFLTPLPSNSYLLVLFALELLAVLILLGVEGAQHCAVVLLGIFSSLARRGSRVHPASGDQEMGQWGGKGGTAAAEPSSRWSFLEVQEGSASRTRQMLLVLVLWCLAIPPANEAVILTSWAAVAVLAAVSILVQEAPCTFQELVNGPRFGVLLSAHDLAVALEATLSGGKLGQSGSSPLARLRRVKGSPFRMGETLAISYRWQQAAVTIAYALEDPDKPVQVNMSRWQMEQVLLEIKRTGLRFVWLDKLSVPQDRSDPWMAELQQTLLSRMMAVYTAAAETLALRSLEEDTGRYHQRAWTFQEYCSSRRLRVVSEPQPEQEPAAGVLEVSGGAALADDEEDWAGKLRSLIQGSMHNSFAVWIRTSSGVSSSLQTGPLAAGSSVDECHHRNVDVEQLAAHLPDLESRVGHFEELYDKLHCQLEADRVRALVPILFNSPTELQSELEGVVRCLAVAFPRPMMKRALHAITGHGTQPHTPVGPRHVA